MDWKIGRPTELTFKETLRKTIREIENTEEEEEQKYIISHQQKEERKQTNENIRNTPKNKENNINVVTT